jgi:uncharacterized protein YjeT (DUF2065 family)
MDTANFVAALLGPLYIVVGAGILLNPDHYQRMAQDFLRSPALTYIGGAMAMAVGLSILYFHNVWRADWTVVITILGWLAALKGAHLLLFPGRALNLWSPLIARTDWLRSLSFGTIAFGIFLTVAAYTWT